MLGSIVRLQFHRVGRRITDTLLPALSCEFLSRAMEKQEVTKAGVKLDNGDFAYGVS